MRRSLYLALAAICIFIFNPISTASFVEEGPYLEMDSMELEAKGTNDFFMVEMSEFGLDEAAALPSLKPVAGIITSGFGRRHRRFHKGIDIGAPRGTPIFASADGKVAFTGRRGGYGRTVILDHGGGVQTLYAHNSQVEVKEGEWVTQGQEISKVGSTGRSTGPHLHYEVRIHGKPVNPKPYLNIQKVNL